jgi:hypothetical protein
MHIRQLFLGIVFALACTGSGCAEMYLAGGVSAVRAAMPDNNSVAKQLESCGNPRGEGVIVFLRASTGCPAVHSWIWVGGSSPPYAVDASALTLTPALKALSDAPEAFRSRVGYSGHAFEEAVQNRICSDSR